MTPVLARRIAAEGLGTMFLLVAVVGSGIAAQRLSPDDPGLQLLETAIATGAALTALILAFHPVSAAFNPIITVIEWRQRTVATGPALVTITAQLIGGVLGAVLANLMFGEPVISIATTERTGPGLWLGEIVATAGLVLVIGGTSRSKSPERVAFADGATSPLPTGSPARPASPTRPSPSPAPSPTRSPASRLARYRPSCSLKPSAAPSVT